jgi:hypothetical protein
MMLNILLQPDEEARENRHTILSFEDPNDHTILQNHSPNQLNLDKH